jgi:hypothetical protein
VVPEVLLPAAAEVTVEICQEKNALHFVDIVVLVLDRLMVVLAAVHLRLRILEWVVVDLMLLSPRQKTMTTTSDRIAAGAAVLKERLHLPNYTYNHLFRRN